MYLLDNSRIKPARGMSPPRHRHAAARAGFSEPFTANRLPPPCFSLQPVIPEDIKTGVKQRLAGAFGDRLRSVVFYGSRVTSRESSENDLDILVVLTGAVDLWEDTHASVRAPYDMQLHLDYSIDLTPVDAEQ